MEQAINFILNNVKYVPKCGNPGSLIVFDPNAYPILASNDINSVIFAAAEFGKGRVFVTSHELYLENFIKYNKEFGTLWFNIKTWLNHGELVDDKEIEDISDYESVNDILKNNVKIVKWVGTCHKNENFISNLLKRYVFNGGAVICGICPWGWLNTSNGKLLEDMSLNKFIFEIGIGFSSSLAVINSYIKTKKNQARNSRFVDNVELLDLDMNKAVKFESFFLNAISSIPNEKAFKYLENLHKVLYKFIISNYKPTFESHVNCPTGRALLTIASRLYQKYSICGIKCRAPNIEEFPTCNLLNPDTISEIVSIKSKYDEFHFSGFYLPPGGCCTVTVLEGNPSGWHVFIGCHTDDLTKMNSFKRWPAITSSLKLKKTLTITSAFGGLIYFESPKGNSTIKVKLDSVAEAPYYDLNKPETIRKWSENSQASSPWAELSGKVSLF